MAQEEHRQHQRQQQVDSPSSQVLQRSLKIQKRPNYRVVSSPRAKSRTPRPLAKAFSIWASFSFKQTQAKLHDLFLKGDVRRKMNFTYVLGFVVLRDVVKVFPVSSSSFARKTTRRNRAQSHSGAWRGLKTKWDLKLSLPSPTYLIRYLFI